MEAQKISYFQRGWENTFTITFATNADKQKLLDGRLYLFDNNLFALQALDSSIQLAKTQFHFELFQIQLHNMPFRYMNRHYGELIDSIIGRVYDVQVDTYDTSWCPYQRVGVDINLSNPLAISRSLNVRDDNLQIPIKYRKLPCFDLDCRRILHVKE